MEIRAYGCRTRYEEAGEHEHVVHHTSRGRAKAEFLAELDMPEYEYTDIRCRCLGRPRTSQAFKDNAEYRGIPFAYVGMMVMVGDKRGWIVGHNSSANLDVLFDDGLTLNCHPNWMITYYDRQENPIAMFTEDGVLQVPETVGS